MLFKLALRNVFRQMIRTAMTLAAIAFGVAGLIVSGGFIQDIFVQLGEAIIHSQTGHAQVFRKEFIERGTRRPEAFLIDDPGSLARQIEKVDGVKEVAARLSFTGLLNNGRRDHGIIGEGVEPDKEVRLGSFITITAGRHLNDMDSYGMILGEGVAHALGLRPGDQVTLVINIADGALNTMDFEIVGVFESFSRDFDARAVRIPLTAAQELMFTDGANVLVANLHRTGDTGRVVALLYELLDGTELEVRDWKSLSDFYEKTIDLYDRQFGVLQLIVLFMVVLSVANSVSMSAFERMSEFGTLEALGSRKRDIIKLIMVENLLIGAIGASLGVMLGVFAALVISTTGIPMPPPPNSNVGYTAYVRIVPATVISAFLIGFLATVIASVVPARRVASTPVVEALQQGY